MTPRIRLALFSLVLFALFAIPAAAQVTKPEIRWVSTLPALCSPTRASQALVYKYTATTGLYRCSATDTWTSVGGSTFTGGAVTTPITFANGTAGAPSISWTNSATTGFFRSAADAIGISTAGTERWVFNSSGALNPFVTRTYDIGGSNLIRDLGLGRTLVATQGTVTASTPFVNHTATWNDGGVTFTNFLSNVTDTASASGSLLMDLQVGGSSKFSVDKAGNIVLPTNFGILIGPNAVLDHSSVSGYVALNRGGSAVSTRIYGDPVFLGNDLTTTVTTGGKISFDATMTAGGTTGAQTINKVSGSVNFAAAAASLVVTNSRVSATSIVHCPVMTDDATLKSVVCVPAAGSFTMFANAAATGETKVGFVVHN